MKRIFFSVVLAVLFSVMTATTFAQRPERITFKPGTRTTGVTGTLNGYGSHKTFVIKVRKGQKLTTNNIGKNHITIGITAPRGSTYEQDMAADCHDRNEVSPTVAGDYRITVTECKKADAWRGTFKFRVTVR